MKRFMIFFMGIMLLAMSASAYVDVTYHYNVNNVDVVGYTCLDAACNRVSTSPWSFSGSTNNGQITITFPSTLQGYGYAIFHTAHGYVPMETKATWHSYGDNGHYDTTSNIEFFKLNNCHSEVDSFVISNDNYENQPVVIYMDASLDATTYSAFGEAHNAVGYIPPQLKNEFYSADTRVTLTVKDSEGRVVYEDHKDLTGAMALYMDQQRRVEFTWTPTSYGRFNATIRTDVIDNQCATQMPDSTSKDFDVWPGLPTGECYSLINNLHANVQYPTINQDLVFSYNKISNYADDNNHLTPVPTHVVYKITNSSGAVVYQSSETLNANGNANERTTHSFSWTPRVAGWYTVSVSGVADSEMCEGLNNPADVISMQLYVKNIPTYKLTVQTRDAYTGGIVSGARVSIDGKSAVTNAQGTAVIEGLYPGDYQYTITRNGYQTTTGDVSITNVDKTIVVVLTPSNRPNDAPIISPPLPDLVIPRNGVNDEIDLDNYVMDAQSADSELVWTFSGNHHIQVSIDNSHRVTFKPEQDWTGHEYITFKVTDPQGAYDTDTIKITVTSHNTAPVISGLPDVTLNENEQRHDVFYLPNYASDRETAAENLIYRIYSTTNNNSTNNQCGVTLGYDKKIDISPANNWHGYCDVTVEVSDGELTDTDTFRVTVLGVNNAPKITTSPVTQAYVGTQYVYDVHAVDPDGDDLTFSLTDHPDGMSITPNGHITMMPQESQIGNHLITIVVTDGELSDTQSFVLNIAELPENNSAPQIISIPINTTQPGVEYQYDVDATDPDGDQLTYYLITYPSGMWINSHTGLITWTPDESLAGTTHFVSVRVTDGELYDTQEYYLRVESLQENHAPTIISTPVNNATIDQLYQYDVDATDPDGDEITYYLVRYPSGMSINQHTGLITWTPNILQTGIHHVTVRASDGELFDDQEFDIYVGSGIEENHAPTIISTPVNNATVGQLYQYDVDATDPDGDEITYYLVRFPDGMSINQHTGLITWTPTEDQAGVHTIIVRASDGELFDTQVFNITVTSHINHAPQIISMPNTTAYDNQEWIYDVVAIDEDNDLLTYSLVTYPNGMTIDSHTGRIRWTPKENQVGANAVTIRVSDGQAYDEQSFYVNVYNINNAPIIISKPVTEFIEEDVYTFTSTYYYDVDAIDPDGDTITYLLASDIKGMTIDPVTGLITWTPTREQVEQGIFDVKVVATDGQLDTMQEYELHIIMPSPESEAQNAITMNRADVANNDFVEPGDIVRITASFTNNDIYDMDSVTMKVIDTDLALYRGGQIETVRHGQTVTKSLPLQIPADTKPGVYYVRISVGDSLGRRRVIYRDFRVVANNN